MFFPSPVTPNIAYISTQLFNHSRFQFQIVPPVPYIRICLYPLLTQYYRRESRVEVGTPPSRIFRICIIRKQHHKILGIIMGGVFVYVYFKTFLHGSPIIIYILNISFQQKNISPLLQYIKCSPSHNH